MSSAALWSHMRYERRSAFSTSTAHSLRPTPVDAWARFMAPEHWPQHPAPEITVPAGPFRYSPLFLALSLGVAGTDRGEAILLLAFVNCGRGAAGPRSDPQR